MFKEYHDSEIKLIQNLFNEGYKLISRSVHHRNQGETKFTMEFAKGNEKREIEFRNPSNKLMDYIHHFHWVFDEQYKRKMIFMDSSEYYSKDNLLRPGKLANSHIEIDGKEFRNFEFVEHVRSLGHPSRFIFILDTKEVGNEHFLQLDFRSELKFYRENKLRFTGNIITFMTDDKMNEFQIICEDAFGRANNLKLAYFKPKHRKGYSANIIAFMADLLDLNYSNKTIHGLDVKKREFLIIIPLTNFKITDSLAIGDVIIIQSISSYDFLNNIDFFSNFDAFATINLKNMNTIYSSINKGIKLIETSINIINYRIKIPVLLKQYHYSNTLTTVRMSDFVYIKDVNHNAEMVFKHPWFSDLSFSKDILIQEYFDPIQLLVNLAKGDSNDDLKTQQLKWILHYLNLAETNSDINIGFLDLWVALDFAVVRFFPSKEKLFSKNEIKEMIEYCGNYTAWFKTRLDEKLENDLVSKIEYEKLILRSQIVGRRLLDLTKMFNQRSLRDKLVVVLGEYGINLTEFEWNLYNSARKKRNKIIHGTKKTIPTKEEYNIISKLVYLIVREAVVNKDI